MAFAQTITEVHESVRLLPDAKLNRIRYLLIYPTPVPNRVVLLFAGGPGNLNIPDDGMIAPTGLGLNFLVRSRFAFVNGGMAVAVVGAPNNVALSPESMRMTDDYAADIAALIADVRRRLPNPAAKVWLVGTSSGTVSVVKTAAKYPKGKPVNHGAADGIVLTSTQVALHQPDAASNVKCTGTIFAAQPPLSSIDVPAFVVTSLGEACPCAKPVDVAVSAVVDGILNRLTHSAPRGHAEIEDAGSRPGADVCTGLTAHGFFNVEDRAVRSITDWIKSH